MLLRQWGLFAKAVWGTKGFRSTHGICILHTGTHGPRYKQKHDTFRVWITRILIFHSNAVQHTAVCSGH